MMKATNDFRLPCPACAAAGVETVAHVRATLVETERQRPYAPGLGYGRVVERERVEFSGFCAAGHDVTITTERAGCTVSALVRRLVNDHVERELESDAGGGGQ